jgi:hypothetical protein
MEDIVFWIAFGLVMLVMFGAPWYAFASFVAVVGMVMWRA